MIPAILLALLSWLTPVPQQPIGGITGHAATGTWTLVNHTNGLVATCSGNLNCTLTIPSTTAGNLLVVPGTSYTTGQVTLTGISSATCTSGWVIPAGTGNYDSTLLGSVMGAYCLNIAAAQTSITMVYSPATFQGSFDILEYHWSGSTIALDGTPSSTDNTMVSTSPAGVAQTLTGSKDVIVQWIIGTGVTAVSGSYTNPFDTAAFAVPSAGYAGVLNTSSGAAPTWTQTISVSVVASMAFKGL